MKTITTDLSDERALIQALDGVDCVIHCAPNVHY